MNELSAVENAIFDLTSKLDELAYRACDVRDVETIHFIVTEQRRLLNLLKTLNRRNLLGNK